MSNILRGYRVSRQSLMVFEVSILLTIMHTQKTKQRNEVKGTADIQSIHSYISTQILIQQQRWCAVLSYPQLANFIVHPSMAHLTKSHIKICEISNLVMSETKQCCFTSLSIAKETWHSVHHELCSCNLAEKFQLCLLPNLKIPTRRSHEASNMVKLGNQVNIICHLSCYDGELSPSRIRKLH